MNPCTRDRELDVVDDGYTVDEAVEIGDLTVEEKYQKMMNSINDAIHKSFESITALGADFTGKCKSLDEILADVSGRLTAAAQKKSQVLEVVDVLK